VRHLPEAEKKSQLARPRVFKEAAHAGRSWAPRVSHSRRRTDLIVLRSYWRGSNHEPKVEGDQPGSRPAGGSHCSLAWACRMLIESDRFAPIDRGSSPAPHKPVPAPPTYPQPICGSTEATPPRPGMTSTDGQTLWPESKSPLIRRTDSSSRPVDTSSRTAAPNSRTLSCCWREGPFILTFRTGVRSRTLSVATLSGLLRDRQRPGFRLLTVRGHSGSIGSNQKEIPKQGSGQGTHLIDRQGPWFEPADLRCLVAIRCWSPLGHSGIKDGHDVRRLVAVWVCHPILRSTKHPEEGA
jgi:hypothetical protein